MSTKQIFTILFLLSSLFTTAQKHYEENWESLAKHEEAPKWFADAKLGIYFHWGVYSVPAFGSEWYPSRMYNPENEVYKHHVETYGDPQEYGYDKFVPLFKAENFNAEEWAELFKMSGARFAGPVAEHHDGYSMWASKLTPWNTMSIGPNRDITGELAKAIKGQDLKFITTFHHARNLLKYGTNEDGTVKKWGHYAFNESLGEPSVNDSLNFLYGNLPPDFFYNNIWFGKLKEVIDNYQPDIIWFDSWLDQVPEELRMKFSAYYLNQAKEWKKEVVIVRKQNDLPLKMSVDDLEKSRKNALEEKVWMTDETISKGSWCYTENLEIKEAKDVLHVLIDIVSKNGVLLLNVSPMADGTIPENQKEVLKTIGVWLEKYGEAIYETRPWYTFGEGPTKEPEGHFKNAKDFLKLKYSNKDFRFTTKGNVIYAIQLGKPDEHSKIELSSFIKENHPVKTVELLGRPDPIRWKQTSDKLIISTPVHSDGLAVAYKITL